jgi:hypothetical protein
MILRLPGMVSPFPGSAREFTSCRCALQYSESCSIEFKKIEMRFAVVKMFIIFVFFGKTGALVM